MHVETNFYNRLQQVTEADRQNLVQATMIQRAINSEVTLQQYIAYLTQAYHHVKFTVPLMMAVGSRLPDSKEWLREAVAEYIEDEIGHQEWILNDIAACGGDRETVRNSKPAAETELMVAYAFDLISRRDPIGFFGMVHVLEGTSVSLADHAARQIKQSLGLPEQAFSYLRSHGAIDQKHIQFLEQLINRFVDPAEQEIIIHSTRMFYRLYKGVFDSLIPQPDNTH
ncbi:MAG: iron-containing redox enzyme family protein [Pseudohongiella sp.]|nr:iron-containing redox enzyme family protein [Pseudohongiella sp.]MDO9520756.1 iron-containing redox enzyme family protein [Pseudohongiella sp.]MDP2126959.1 iron-containing redox enzyme family protein [Pseudohongiella sp.]